MKKIIGLGMLLLFAFTGCRSALQIESLRLYDLHSGRILAGRAATDALKRVRLIVVGEHHADKWHHAAELAVIQAMYRTDRPIAIGLEMFRKDNQADLNRWIAGKTPEQRFEAIYLDNWNFDWNLYRSVFLYARDRKIPMVGLNIPPQVSSQVAHAGFNSLSDKQKEGLKPITCDATPQYRAFIRQAYDAHAHAGMQFENFCEAQLLWDTAMARNAVAYLEKHPQTAMVLLTGSGHARKPGIPARVQKLSALPVAVLLPQTRGIFEPGLTTPAEADYLIAPF